MPPLDPAAATGTAGAAPGGPPPGWAPPPPATGPWGPGVPPPAQSWQQEPPPGWNQPAPAPRPATTLADPADEAGWLPVSAADRGAAPAAGRKPGECWNCGQKNGRSREYCKRCGQRLDSDLMVRAAASHHLTPVKGGRGRRAVAFLWTVIVLAAIVVVGVIAFGGFVPRSADPTPPLIAASLEPSPLASGLLVASSSPAAAGSPAASALVPFATPTPAPTPTPTAAPTPAPTPAPTAAPAVSLTPEPASTLPPASTSTPGPIRSTASPRAPAPPAFDCKGQTAIKDPLNRPWALNGIYWAERADYDRVTLRLVPDPDGKSAASRVNIETVPIDEVPVGLPTPAQGDVATIIRFSPATSLTRALQGSPDKTALKTLTALTASDGRVHAILGVVGKGCYAIQSPMWDDPSTQDTPFVDITVDIGH